MVWCLSIPFNCCRFIFEVKGDSTIRDLLGGGMSAMRDAIAVRVKTHEQSISSALLPFLLLPIHEGLTLESLFYLQRITKDQTRIH